MNNIQKCKDILEHLNNKDTKIIEKEDFKGSYYSYINDTIYLSGENKITKSKEEEFIILCHECIHSIQNKTLQAVNFYSSNIEIILSILVILLLIIKVNFVKYLVIPYFLIMLLNIIVRFLLEKDAVKGSFKLAKDIIKDDKYDISKIESMKDEAKTKQIVFYLSLFWKKILKTVIILILICL